LIAGKRPDFAALQQQPFRGVELIVMLRAWRRFETLKTQANTGQNRRWCWAPRGGCRCCGRVVARWGRQGVRGGRKKAARSVRVNTLTPI
jgi:hypothetical protein